MTNVLNRKKVLLYAGSDFSTLLTLNKLIPGLIEMGVEPIMIFTATPHLINAESAEMDEFSFFDKNLMNDSIIPFMNNRTPVLDKNGNPKKKICYSPKHLCEIYSDGGVKAYSLGDVNSVEHLKYVQSDENIVGGISIRCLQIFQQPIIDAHVSKKDSFFKVDGFLWNIHPGRLPDYRGVLPIFRAAADNRQHIEWTLHAIQDKTIDTGEVYGETSLTVDPEISVLGHYSEASDAVSAMIFKNVSDVLEYGNPRTRRTQDRKIGKLFLLPTPKEIKTFKDKGGVWVDKPSEERKVLLSSFANGSEHAPGLKAEVMNAINARYGRPVSEPIEQKKTMPSAPHVLPHSDFRLMA